MIKAINNGEDILLLKTLYAKPRKQDTGKYSNDILEVVYRDNKTNKKYLATIESPKYDIYVADPNDVPSDYSLRFIDKNKVNKLSISYRNKEREIAEILGDDYVNYYWDKVNERNRSATQNLHKAKRIFRSDINIEDMVRIDYFKNCKPSKYDIHKSYLDIEVDGINYKGFPDEELAPCPINAITYIDQKLKVSYTMLLRNKENPLIAEFEENIEEFIKEMSEEFKRELFTDKNGEEIFDLEYKIYMFDDEVELINAIFQLINMIKPDYCMAWNACFDYLTIINRLIQHGVDPVDVMCHPDFKSKECYYYKDKKSFTAAARGDYARISSYTEFIDQLINYAGLRKGGSKASNKLNDVGLRDCGVGKESYKHVTKDLSKLPYLDYKLFVKYNIRDVIVQLLIELKNEDLDDILNKSITNVTRPSKIFKQSVFLKNRFSLDYEIKHNLIIGNNLNMKYGEYSNEEKEEKENKEKFEGAVVGDPELNGYNGIVINGHKSKYVYENIVDFDLSSLYPSIIRAFFIAINTQHFRVIIEESVSDKENIYGSDKYDRGGDFIDNFETKSYGKIANKWFNLPNYKEIIDEYFTDEAIEIAKKELSIDVELNGLKYAIDRDKEIVVISRIDKTEGIKPIVRI